MDSQPPIQLKVGKNSLKLNIDQDKFMEYIRKYRAKKMFKSSRSRSISSDQSSQKEEAKPLLLTLSEIHFADDLLDVISEDSNEYTAGDDESLSTGQATFQLGSSPRKSEQSFGVSNETDEENKHEFAEPPQDYISVQDVTGKSEESTL